MFPHRGFHPLSIWPQILNSLLSDKVNKSGASFSIESLSDNAALSEEYISLD